MRRTSLPTLAVLGGLLALGAGCAHTASASDVATGGSSAANPPAAARGQDPASAPRTARSDKTTAHSKPPKAPSWPTPADCISYNPNNLTVSFQSGVYVIADGGKTVARISGQQGENTGDKGLALAKRYTSHCFLGRGNTREEKNSFVFDYWRYLSGIQTTIADQDQDCSGYNRNNLTVEDMGDGNGWRVKDHDHVLHLFDNETDARNGKLVLAKYSQICFLGDGGDDDPELVSYLP